MVRDKISVIIPTYKRCDGLGQAIESVLNQSYSNIEIVVVDDNDSDSTYRQLVSELMNKYVGNDKIQYIKHPMNCGGSAARNTGVRAATGSIVAFLDDDDRLLNDYIEKMYLKMIQDNCKMVYMGNYYKFDGQYTYVKKRKYEKEKYSLKDVFVENCLISIFFMIRRDYFLQYGMFDESLRGYQDCDMWIKIARKTEIGVVQEPLAVCNRDQNIRITSNILQREKALNALVDKWRKNVDDEDRKNLEVFYERQKEELQKQRENAFLFERDRVSFRFFLEVLSGRYTRMQKVKIFFFFLFGKNGSKYYKWLEFEVFNSKITFLR